MNLVEKKLVLFFNLGLKLIQKILIPYVAVAKECLHLYKKSFYIFKGLRIFFEPFHFFLNETQFILDVFAAFYL